MLKLVFNNFLVGIGDISDNSVEELSSERYHENLAMDFANDKVYPLNMTHFVVLRHSDSNFAGGRRWLLNVADKVTIIPVLRD